MQQEELQQSSINKQLPLELRKEILEEKIEKLKLICDQLDPYSPISNELKVKLAEFQIDHKNHFYATLRDDSATEKELRFSSISLW